MMTVSINRDYIFHNLILLYIVPVWLIILTGHISIIRMTVVILGKAEKVLMMQQGPYMDGTVYVQITFPSQNIWDNMEVM